MSPKLLGVLRSIGILLFFTVATALIGAIPDVLTQIPVIGSLITPGIALAVTAFVAAQEHVLAVKWGYNLPAQQ